MRRSIGKGVLFITFDVNVQVHFVPELWRQRTTLWKVLPLLIERHIYYSNYFFLHILDTCRDDPWSSFSGQCTFYHFIGSCYHSPQRMSHLCPLTCGYCRPTCIDTSEYCHFFSFYGYCAGNDVVRKRCRKTCKLCKTI